MRKQEQTRLAELDAEKIHHGLIQAQIDIVGSCCLCLSSIQAFHSRFV